MQLQMAVATLIAIPLVSSHRRYDPLKEELAGRDLKVSLSPKVKFHV